jgi:DMSO reductase anchor subunit
MRNNAVYLCRANRRFALRRESQLSKPPASSGYFVLGLATLVAMIDTASDGFEHVLVILCLLVLGVVIVLTA